MEYDVKDMTLAESGTRRIEWTERDMPVLRHVRERFARERPFADKRLSACLHVTAETAQLMLTLKAGGADVLLVASNPLSTQDDIAAALVAAGIPVYAVKGEDRDTFFKHIEAAIAHRPHLTMDDGADLVSTIHTKHPELLAEMIGGTEETTTGVIRLRAMAQDGALKMPVVAVNDAKTKNLFDNRYGTGQSTLEAIVRATGMLVAGKTFVVAGYGWCGKGLAMRARGMGASVMVTEVDPIKALEAAMDGFSVVTMQEAAPLGDLFCTVTGDIDVIRGEHFKRMKDGAFVCNAGHFDVEVRVADLQKLAGAPTRIRDHIDEYTLCKSDLHNEKSGEICCQKGRRIYVMAEGRLVNLAAAEGHPASVMDMSFSTQALACEWMARQAGLLPAVYEVSPDIEETVASLKLASMGLSIDTLTPEQKAYLASWQHGT